MLERAAYEGARAYGQSKLAQIMMTMDLAVELEGTGVTANAVHPAVYMATSMVLNRGGTPMTTIDEGADPVMQVIMSPTAGSGNYWRQATNARAQAQAYDLDARRRLHDLAMQLRVNGEVRQESHSGRMSVTIAQILSNFSGLTYSAGDVLSTGTVSGVAGFKSPEERARLYLKPGDLIEAEIERIGVLRNPVVSWQEAHGEPAPPRIRPWGDS